MGTDTFSAESWPKRLSVPFFALLGVLANLCSAAPLFTEFDLFNAGSHGYHTFRVPALVTTSKGTLLAFAEGRKDSRSDSGDINIVLRRSRDHGRTWSELQVVADNGGDTIGNPTPVVVRKSGTILLLLTANPAKAGEAQFMAGAPGGTRTVWITSSRDDGQTWTALREITSMAKQPEWGWYATGPGNGIQLKDGRIVIPCNHTVKPSKTLHSHVIFSDDGGGSWHIGGSAGVDTDESAVFERADGSLMLNMRADHNQQGIAKKHRAVAVSTDRGATWSELTWDETLVEPVCQASIVRYDVRRHMVLFSNPAHDIKRMRMTVRLSYDDAATWPVARTVHKGPASYSSLAVLGDRTIGLLYERGLRHFREMITFARFNVEWLRTGETPAR
jgi:sialidase-1